MSFLVLKYFGNHKQDIIDEILPFGWWVGAEMLNSELFKS